MTPDLTNLTTKSLQMDALRNIRNHLSAGLKIINKRENEMKALLREMQPSHQRGTNLPKNGIQIIDSRTNISSYSYQQSPSIAKQIIRQNTPDSSSEHYNNQHMEETKTDPQSGLQHLFDKDNNRLSRFPVGFRGCYNCGKPDHFSTIFCLEAKSGNFNKATFFNKMWVHKPHTKKLPHESVSVNGGSSINDSMNQYNHSNISSNHHSNNYSNDVNTNMGVGNNLNLGVGNNLGVGKNMGVEGNNLNLGVWNNMGVDGNNLNLSVGNNMGVDGNNLNLGVGNNMGVDGSNLNIGMGII